MDAGGAALEQHVREATGRCSGIKADESGWGDPEGIERRRKLVAAAADVGILGRERDREIRLDQVAGLPVRPDSVAGSGSNLSRKDQRLGAGAGRGKAALDDELVEALPAAATGRGWAHAAIVAQPHSRRLNAAPSEIPVTTRPRLRMIGIAVVLVIGLSGLFVGLQLSLAMLGAAGASPAGPSIGAGIAVYGLLLTVAGIGLVFRRRWAMAIAVTGLVAGIVTLVGLMVATGADGILGMGTVIWGVTLACLLAGGRRSG